MNAQARKITWTGMGLLLALTAGAPAIADDTELFLFTPDPAVKPNILFILDTSGSMDDVVTTQAPYDAEAPPYPGDCDSNSIYWTAVDVTPNCTGNTHFVSKSAFVCNAANGQLAGIGSYADTLVQHRATADPAVSRWQELAPGNAADQVECMADSGVHGDGTAGQLYASNGGSAFTNDPNQELAWGSAPAAVTYTVYDGNYLNWKSSPTTVQLSKIDILKAVTNAVLQSISNVNVGIMQFNNNNGGLVIKAVSDLDSDRDSMLQTIDGLTAAGNTPLAESMYEAALYWRGMVPNYGLNNAATDPAALGGGGNYLPPATAVCSRNFNVLVSDGLPNGDTEAAALVGNLPDFAVPCDGTGEGACLDDIAQHLATVDIDTVQDDDQLVATHTIGFALDIQNLRDTAADSDGRYFMADDVETLATALLNIISDITELSLSFSAPSVSVNSFNRTQNLNDLYLTVFASKTNVHWPGNLKKFRLEASQIVDANGQPAVDPSNGLFFDSPAYTARSIWTDGAADGNDVTVGGAAHEQPVPASRNLFTNMGANDNLSAGANAIAPGNVAAFSAADFGLTGAAGEPTLTEMIQWMRGADIRDEDFDPATTVRHAMGDPLHSQPAAVVYGGSASAPDVVVFAATNDGYLHAIDGDTGAELWSFIPKELLSDMNRLFFDPKSNFKHYGIDGDIVPVIMDNNRNGVIETSDNDFIYIVFGLRRGGNSYYALDVTTRNSPRLLWQAQFPEFGQTWSTPVVTRVNVTGVNANEAVVIVGGGYDAVHDTRAHPSSADAQGAGIHMLDLETGNPLWSAGPDGSGANLELDTAGREMTRAIPTRISVIDISGDGLADRMYAADLGGQIWRFDITNGVAANALVAGGIIARLGAEGAGTVTAANTRRFYNSPDVALFTDPLQNRRFISVSIGSGYRAHPLDNAAEDRFFSIRDPDVFNQLSQTDYDNYDIITDDDLVEVSGQVRVVIDSDDRGWKFTLPGNQKVIAGSVTFDDSIFFVGFSPEVNATETCVPATGRNFLYQVSVVNGDPVANNLDTLLPDEANAERVTELAQGGIAPTPAFLFPSATDPDCEGADCVVPPIGCVGVECFNPGFVNNPVRTLWTQDGIE